MSDRYTLGHAYEFLPWHCHRFLEDGLKSLCEVRYFGTPHRERPGFCPDDNILDLVENGGSELGAFLFTEECLFAGITDLECPTAIWFEDYWPGDYQRLRYARLFDHVFMSHRDWLGDFVAAGCQQVHCLPFACDPYFHRDHNLERIYDVGFVGHINPEKQKDRVQILTQLSQRYRTNDFFQRYYLEEMAIVYSQSKIVVNIPYMDNFNSRGFEGMSSGALVLTQDTGHGQTELFKAGIHLDFYRNTQELFQKIDYYLAHDDERKQIALAGQREVLEKHRYVDRAQLVLDVLKQNQGGPSCRTTDKDEILRIYALNYSQRNRPDLLLRSFRRSRCSLSTRAYIGARLLKSTLNVLRG